MTFVMMMQMNNTDTLKLLRGKDFQLTEQIVIRQPTLGEIADFGEQRFMNMLSPFVCSPFDMIAQLDMIGIDFTTVTEYELFCLLVGGMSQSETSILFGETDFAKYKIVETAGGNRQLMYGKSVISEPIYHIMSNYLCKMNNLAQPKYKKVGNEFTKQKLIEYAYTDLRNAKRKKYKSSLTAMVSAATNHPFFKYGINEVWEIKAYAFFDAIKRINIIENSQYLRTAIYSGNIDVSKIDKKDLDWLRTA